tara:strand:+ start:55 stop:387 length:333 start_codon:yes stop_codon:yes gene_type:complete
MSSADKNNIKNKFTIEVYKKDKRITSRSDSVRLGNNKPGLRFVLKQDYEGKTLADLKNLCKTGYPERLKFVTEIHETFVIRKHMMTGEDHVERYDLPRYCSPSSESYWSM